MISTDLHAHNYFIGLASNYGAESGNGFGKCKGCATVQNTERLTGAMVYGHGCFYGVNDDGVIVGLENPQADIIAIRVRKLLIQR